MTENPIDAVKARLDGGRRWTKVDGGDDYQGNLCLLLTALEIDCGEAIPLIRETAFEQFPERNWRGAGDVVIFNDHPDTVWADVELVLEKARLLYEDRVLSEAAVRYDESR